MIQIIYIIIAIMAILMFGVLGRYVLGQPKPEHFSISSCSLNHKGTCLSNPSYGPLDPVNDPSYNVRETLKNTVLIEQHLAEKNKYCKACIVKHFLISCGLLSEAISMAGDGIAKYPNLEESARFYDQLFEEWRTNMDNDKTRLATLEKLREWRRQMVDLYFMKSPDSL